MDTPATIHAFWFGPAADEDEEDAIIERQSALWWKKQPEVDAAIRARFAPLVGRAAGGELDAWLGGLRGRLALILLTDQFPRNIWRGEAAAFAFDVLALRWAKDTLRLGLDAAWLSGPDGVAMLAGNAWAVSTGGAAVLRRIADTVIDAMEHTA